MERLEQYCREHGWKIILEDIAINRWLKMVYSNWGKTLIVYKKGNGIRRKFQIGMNIDSMIEEMKIMDSVSALPEAQLEFPI